jgi:hypothetical protein
MDVQPSQEAGMELVVSPVSKISRFTDLSHNPMNKNLILATGRWVLGIGVLEYWGKNFKGLK